MIQAHLYKDALVQLFGGSNIDLFNVINLYNSIEY